ncbi:hypothetical protein Syn7502_01191 [Synechococcus sp. PCC 7502]|uniref:RloB family protein n=1 Tax=Synechococcus sp. PCC 7502 TaxID=1173263 RepID=UPI00029F92BC|nr:RloB family protein [Synechococcus sp. PCC 7502]AFY73294.1 hypothetical protein Syn7502_01191 [Synechococcus sp. PCC 7502]
MAKSFKRNDPTIPVGKKILIACEGKYTEPRYFYAIREDLRLNKELIKVVPHDGTDPLSIVNALVEARQDAKSERRWSSGDSAWAVMDGDEHITNNPANWYQAIQRAKSQKINLAITNPSIEFWYLIHFQDHFANIQRDKATELLKQHIPAYDKSVCYYFNLLKPNTPNAIARANKLTNLSKGNNLSEYSNPCCSGISRLVQSLFSLGN